MYVPVTGSSDGGATSVCGGNLSDSTAEGGPPTLDAYDTDAASLVSSAHHIYQREYLIIYTHCQGNYFIVFLGCQRLLKVGSRQVHRLQQLGMILPDVKPNVFDCLDSVNCFLMVK